jgi:peptidoglycan/LPS O-acetylase OafA/YrhL
MLIHRRRDRIRWSLPPWVILVMVGIGLGYSPPAALRAGYDIAMILAGFPILVASAIGREPVIGSGTFRLLGIASYAIYVLHYPAQRLVRAVVQVLTHRDVADFAPWSGLVLLLALVGGCWAVDKIYDQPIRRWLGTRVNQARRDRSSAARPARRGCGEP